MVPCEVTDGSRSTFINPLDSDALPFIGDRINYQIYQNHGAANLLTNIQANAVGGLTTGLAAMNAGSTITASYWHPLDGQYCFLVKTVGGPASDVGISTSSGNQTAIVANEDYTIQASFLPIANTNTYIVRGVYLTAAEAQTGSPFNDSSLGVEGEWLHLRATATAPSDAAYLRIDAYRSTSANDWFLIACLGISPGDFGRWFLPSLSPRLIEYTGSVPPANKRLTFSAPSCERWARVVLSRNQQMAAIELLGDTSVQQMNLSEVIFT